MSSLGQPRSPVEYDIVIVGAGPVGRSLAREAVNLGLSTCIVCFGDNSSLLATWNGGLRTIPVGGPSGLMDIWGNQHDLDSISRLEALLSRDFESDGKSDLRVRLAQAFSSLCASGWPLMDASLVQSTVSQSHTLLTRAHNVLPQSKLGWIIRSQERYVGAADEVKNLSKCHVTSIRFEGSFSKTKDSTVSGLVMENPNAEQRVYAKTFFLCAGGIGNAQLAFELRSQVDDDFASCGAHETPLWNHYKHIVCEVDVGWRRRRTQTVKILGGKMTRELLPIVDLESSSAERVSIRTWPVTAVSNSQGPQRGWINHIVQFGHRLAFRLGWFRYLQVMAYFGTEQGSLTLQKEPERENIVMSIQLPVSAELFAAFSLHVEQFIHALESLNEVRWLRRIPLTMDALESSDAHHYLGTTPRSPRKSFASLTSTGRLRGFTNVYCAGTSTIEGSSILHPTAAAAALGICDLRRLRNSHE